MAPWYLKKKTPLRAFAVQLFGKAPELDSVSAELSIVRIISTGSALTDPASRPQAHLQGGGRQGGFQLGTFAAPLPDFFSSKILSHPARRGISLHVEILVGGRDAGISNLHVR